MKGYPKTFTYSMYVTLFMLFLSGLALLPHMLLFRWELDMEEWYENATRMKIAAVHLLAGFSFIWFVGALWTVHIRSGLRKKMRLITGFSILACVLTLVFTGIGNYYLSDDIWLKWNSTFHAGIGISICLMFLLHRRK